MGDSMMKQRYELLLKLFIEDKTLHYKRTENKANRFLIIKQPCITLHYSYAPWGEDVLRKIKNWPGKHPDIFLMGVHYWEILERDKPAQNNPLKLTALSRYKKLIFSIVQSWYSNFNTSTLMWTQVGPVHVKDMVKYGRVTRNYPEQTVERYNDIAEDVVRKYDDIDLFSVVYDISKHFVNDTRNHDGRHLTLRPLTIIVNIILTYVCNICV